MAATGDSRKTVDQDYTSLIPGGHVRLDLLCALNLCRWKGSVSSARHIEIMNKILEEEGHDTKHEEPRTMPKGVDFRCSTRSFPTSWLRALQEFSAEVKLGVHEAVCVGSGVKMSEVGKGAEAGSTCKFGGVGSRGREAVEQLLAEGSESHLVLRTCEGYMIPVDFDGPPLFDTSGKVPGGWVGSTQRLMQELLELAPHLDIILRPLKGRVRRGGGLDLSTGCIAELERDLCHAGEISEPEQQDKERYRRGGGGGGEGADHALVGLRKSEAASPSVATSPHPFFRERSAWYVLYEAVRLSDKCKSAVVLRN